MSVFALLIAARVASLNLCVDEYLLLLARPSEVASVSFLSHDRLESPLWRQARRFPANRGALEDVLVHHPDTILTMGGAGRSSALIARRAGLRSVDLPMPTTIDGVSDNLRRVATVLGDVKRAGPWTARLDRLRAHSPARAKDSIWLGGGGESLAEGSLGSAWLRLAGLRQRRLNGARASLETLLARPPQVLVESHYRRGQRSAASQWMNHPIVRNLRSTRLATDGRRWTCMGPALIPEIERLKKAAQ